MTKMQELRELYATVLSTANDTQPVRTTIVLDEERKLYSIHYSVYGYYADVRRLNMLSAKCREFVLTSGKTTTETTLRLSVKIPQSEITKHLPGWTKFSKKFRLKSKTFQESESEPVPIYQMTHLKTGISTILSSMVVSDRKELLTCALRTSEKLIRGRLHRRSLELSKAYEKLIPRFKSTEWETCEIGKYPASETRHMVITMNMANDVDNDRILRKLTD